MINIKISTKTVIHCKNVPIATDIRFVLVKNCNTREVYKVCFGTKSRCTKSFILFGNSLKYNRREYIQGLVVLQRHFYRIIY